MECPICNEKYSSDVSLRRRPQLLPCGHEACESCLEQLHSSNKQTVIECPICNAQHTVNPSSLPIVYGRIQESTTTDKCTTGASSEEHFGEVDRKVLHFNGNPDLITSLRQPDDSSLDKKPWHVVVVDDTIGFFMQSGVVVTESSDLPMPSPALLVCLYKGLHGLSDHLLVCHENGDVKGKIQLKHEPCIQGMTVAGNGTENGNDSIIISDSHNKCVRKLSLSGDVLKTSPPKVVSDPWGLCCLSDGRVAVSDAGLKSVQILSQKDLSYITSVQHPNFKDPSAVTVTSSHLVVTNWKFNARLLFFSLSDFSFVKFGDEDLKKATKLLHYKGNIFTGTKDNNKVIQMSESGTPISIVGSLGNGVTQFNYPAGVAIISRNGAETLVVCDCENFRLKFYKL